MGGLIRILYVDTEPTETAAVLEAENDRFVVETATSASEGFDRLTDAAFDCIVSAHEPPKIDGIEFLDTVRSEDPDLPFVLFTDNGGEAVASAAIAAGITDAFQRTGDREQYATLATRIVTAVDGHETDSERRQSALKALHDVATTLQTEETVTAVCERTVAAAADILEFYMCSVMVREGEWLVPYAVSAGAGPDGSRRMRIDQGLAGKTYQRGESFVVREVEPDDETEPAKLTYRSAISVPIGNRGVFQAVSTVPDTFDAENIELAELLVSHTASVIEQLEREAVLKRQNDRLDAFASIVTHDLRNPLNVAEGRLELAREASDNEHLEDVAVALDRMDALIDDVLTLSRQGEAVRDAQSVSLSDLCETSWETVATADATLVTDIDRSIRADRSRLQALLENLFRNAVEHGSTSPASEPRQDAVEHNSTSPASQAQRDNGRCKASSEPSVATAPEDAVEHGSTSPASQAQQDAPEHGGGDLAVTVGTLEDGTGFYVEDDGTGISEAERESVFESGYSTEPAGTGLGLAIVSDIVDAHGWDCALTTGTAGGARFEISGVEWADAESRAHGYSTEPSVSK
ncbi:ATP-binding protein [Natronorubrum sp. DTA28]|uniref:sensor histidine kinase n=1 Tax=Natronorubrum sp. DTA28 TaxID=3447019 RepID=UPI003F847B66